MARQSPGRPGAAGLPGGTGLTVREIESAWGGFFLAVMCLSRGFDSLRSPHWIQITSSEPKFPFFYASFSP